MIETRREKLNQNRCRKSKKLKMRVYADLARGVIRHPARLSGLGQGYVGVVHRRQEEPQACG